MFNGGIGLLFPFQEMFQANPPLLEKNMEENNMVQFNSFKDAVENAESATEFAEFLSNITTEGLVNARNLMQEYKDYIADLPQRDDFMLAFVNIELAARAKQAVKEQPVPVVEKIEQSIELEQKPVHVVKKIVEEKPVSSDQWQKIM
jgi:hypothetical protein